MYLQNIKYILPIDILLIFTIANMLTCYRSSNHVAICLLIWVYQICIFLLCKSSGPLSSNSEPWNCWWSKPLQQLKSRCDGTVPAYWVFEDPLLTYLLVSVPSEKYSSKIDHFPKWGWNIKIFETTTQFLIMNILLIRIPVTPKSGSLNTFLR